MKVVNATELYILKWLILGYVNFTSIKNKNTEQKGPSCRRSQRVWQEQRMMGNSILCRWGFIEKGVGIKVSSQRVLLSRIHLPKTNPEQGCEGLQMKAYMGPALPLHTGAGLTQG